ncbi:MAG TPA: 2,3-bisphosphoglycerate-independent phosphoglycerate mutase [Candidatus Ratteibacteria bacterium]|uniref:Cofactor-independent phosphoglycerate mutase n=1 Tax=candidate division TA06 bacterium ADurb.Bin131 TaxID=1852827 RepID=A0A1V6CAG3_UNCT6|nr:MAG: cofactor-independent phosphoglycerate mutase [candidate division TA06 bacterium ADurb.Bin131]HOC03619.1 2,3-bisphosphoglycerate-independent phosphoglycerate mutase [bacterium]HRS06203.1 2,3-bisphosphoglycerate-independent phosphoglycerate mutase [Candidatus Ratteibacteria bacterium]HON05387.1 2,3-bisphosphoglycerate-independent phosphoglycerate mutase [bacterium]HPC29038.1 2,3-bisphosphoglycerate-independent phosphoglycerate mutase [bacterium]
MEVEKIIKEIIKKNDKKILLLIMDGLGGLPEPTTHLTELETAKKPYLDEIARVGMCGLSIPVLPGITPGSGPAHLSLFGYDPVEHKIGRGVLEVLGVGMEMDKNDIAIRGNFATIDENNIVTDRRAGRIPTEQNQKIVQILQEKIKVINGVEIIIKTVKEHRLAILLKGKNLSPDISENDPQKEGLPLRKITPLKKNAEFTAGILNEFLKQAEKILAQQNTKARTILLRGFSGIPDIESFEKKYLLNPVCIASYPMYKGLAKLVGMNVIAGLETIDDEIEILNKVYNDYDFFYLHYKKTDSAGEDGDFNRKVQTIEEFDTKIRGMKNLKFDVICLTGDHSTPSVLKGHSWHPVPIVIVSQNIIPDDVNSFTERACAKGMLGTIPATSIMYILLANALKLEKFGA